jgi:hypothetical protein
LSEQTARKSTIVRRVVGLVISEVAVAAMKTAKKVIIVRRVVGVVISEVAVPVAAMKTAKKEEVVRAMLGEVVATMHRLSPEVPMIGGADCLSEG